jgi:GntR family transcriptional regulator
MPTNAALATPSSLPLYIQITELLTREIAAGRWASGDRLPPEAELSDMLGVAVGTLRKALAELDARGHLERKQGSGTYIRHSTKIPGQGQGKSIYEFFKLELLKGGGLPSATVVDFQKIVRPDFVPPLAGGSTTFCYRVRRLRSLSAIPVAIEEIYFDARHRPQLRVEDLGEALYLFYQQRLGFWIAHAQDSIYAGIVPDWSPILFAPPVGAMCPKVERLSWSGKNQLEEYSITWFDAERCRYVNRVK